MTVYLDILFLMNFFMDYLVISLSGILSSQKFRHDRKLIASLLGAVLGVIHFVFARHTATSLLFGLTTPPIIVLSLLYPKQHKLFARCLLSFFGSAFIVSGTSNFVLNLLGIEGSGLTSPIVYLSGGLIFLLAKHCFSRLKSTAMKGSYEITVRYGEYSLSCHAQLDTGNSLTDPITKSPVIVADESLLSMLFASGCNSVNLTEWIDPLDLRIIPYKTIDKTGAMTGFAPTELVINGRSVPNAVIAISSNKITDGVLLNSAVI